MPMFFYEAPAEIMQKSTTSGLCELFSQSESGITNCNETMKQIALNKEFRFLPLYCIVS